MGIERREDVLDPEQENTGIPEEPTAGEHLGRRRGIRFLDKALERHGVTTAPVQFEIPIAGLGPVGADAEKHQLARLERFQAGLDRGAEGGGISDLVICRRHQHCRVGILGMQIQRRRKHSRRGVAPLGLDQDRARIDADGGKLFGHDEAEIRVGHGDGLVEAGRPAQPHRGLLKQALFLEKAGKLLRKALP